MVDRAAFGWPYMPYRTPYAAVNLTGITVYGTAYTVPSKGSTKGTTGRDGCRFTVTVKPSDTVAARSPTS
jgi:hypothetical protein